MEFFFTIKSQPEESSLFTVAQFPIDHFEETSQSMSQTVSMSFECLRERWLPTCVPTYITYLIATTHHMLHHPNFYERNQLDHSFEID